MNKKLSITIMGILLVGIISAVSLTLNDISFKEKVSTISSLLFYNKLLNLGEINSKEIPKETELSLDSSGLEITKSKEGVLKVRAK